MSYFQLPLSYLSWHYTAAWGDLFRLHRNFSWFLLNFFSIRILLRTLFSPWHRLHEGGSSKTAGFVGSFILNLMLRCIGLAARSATILTGLVALLLLSLFSIAFLVAWLFLPLLPLVCIVNGIAGVFSF